MLIVNFLKRRWWTISDDVRARLDLRQHKRFLHALEHGEFQKIMKDPAPLWRFFERQASTPHTKQVALRLVLEDWDLWATYRIDSTNPIAFRLDRLFIPDGKQHAKAKPEEIEGLPIFEVDVETT